MRCASTSGASVQEVEGGLEVGFAAPAAGVEVTVARALAAPVEQQDAVACRTSIRAWA